MQNILAFCILLLLCQSCNNEINCSKANKALKNNNCNIVVTNNLNKTPHWGYHNLK